VQIRCKLATRRRPCCGDSQCRNPCPPPRGNVAAAEACTAAVAAAEVKGAWLSAAAGVEASHLMSVTDEVSEHLARRYLNSAGGTLARPGCRVPGPGRTLPLY
jgi:hypothetical protein